MSFSFQNTRFRARDLGRWELLFKISKTSTCPDIFERQVLSVLFEIFMMSICSTIVHDPKAVSISMLCDLLCYPSVHSKTPSSFGTMIYVLDAFGHSTPYNTLLDLRFSKLF